jgi:predicted metalloprotease with PDZ domain
MRRVLVGLILLVAGGDASAGPEAITVSVDATEAPRRIFHARLTIPAAPGPLTLLYPEWIPGEHGPTGPIADLAGLRLAAGGQPVRWRRDPVNLYALRCDVPPGASALDVELDYLSPTDPGGFTSGASASARLMVLNWNQVVVYPEGRGANELHCDASLRLPPGWRYGTALPVERESAEGIQFRRVTLGELVDSPVVAGAHFLEVDLAHGGEVVHRLLAAADSEAALEMGADLRSAYQRLVAEANALFGARHYRGYHFLVTLSDHTAHFGLEHHESSDNRSYERAFIDEDRRRLMAGLLPHEMVHSWNGKYRRPANLTLFDFSRPAKGDLLWVYEGLTTYLGDVLAARSGLRTREEYLDGLAIDAAELANRAGRTWRPLLDTAVAARRLFGARDAWANWRRGVDFYAEGGLVWLEADVLIRQETRGRRSLDDFCRRFHGGASGPPEVRTYTLDDVLAALGEVASHDWRGFLERRLTSLDPEPPVGGIVAGGWRLAYTEDIPTYLRSVEEVRGITDVSHSIGIVLDKDGVVQDVVPGKAADRAAVAPGMKLVAVNGRRWSPNVLREALRATKASPEPLELLVENAEYYATHRLDYHDGPRYPHLERDPSRPDILSEIVRPRTAPPAAPK